MKGEFFCNGCRTHKPERLRGGKTHSGKALCIGCTVKLKEHKGQKIHHKRKDFKTGEAARYFKERERLSGYDD